MRCRSVSTPHVQGGLDARMEEHKLSDPLCALQVKHSSTQHLPDKQKLEVGGKSGDSRTAPQGAPIAVSAAMSKTQSQSCSRQQSEAASSASTRRNSSFAHLEGVATSTSPDGSYISSPFFPGSPMDFPESLHPRGLNVAADMQCSLSTPLEKFFDVLESTDIPVATPSRLATVCTHHTTSPAADAGDNFPLVGDGAGAQDNDELDKACPEQRAPSADSETHLSTNAFPIRHNEQSNPVRNEEGEARASVVRNHRSSNNEDVARCTNTGVGSSDAYLVEKEKGSAIDFNSTKGVEPIVGHPPAFSSSVSASVARGAPSQQQQQQQQSVASRSLSDAVAASDADRLLVDFQLLLILLFDQVCNVVPGLRRQDGGAFYSMHLQRIASGPLHPTLASYADVLLPICSAMSFFSSNDKQKQQQQQEGVLSTALRYLARHGTVPAAPIAEMVAKCPAAVFMQVVSALEGMYHLQRLLSPGAPEPSARVSAELDPKTLWGDAVAEMERAAGALAGGCMQQDLGAPSTLAEASAPPVPQKNKNHKSLAEATPLKRQIGLQETQETDNRGRMLCPALVDMSLADLRCGNASSVEARPCEALTLPSGNAGSGLVADARGEASPAFISASVNKRRHPNVQAEILSSCCPERLAQRGTRLLGEVLQKLQSEQTMRPASKPPSPHQAIGGSVDQNESVMRQQGTSGAALLAEGESDSLSSGSARGKRKLPATRAGAPAERNAQSLGEALAQLAALQQTAGSSSAVHEADEMLGDAATDSQLKKHGYGLRKGGAKRGRKTPEEGTGRGRARLTPVKAQPPHPVKAKPSTPPSPSDGQNQQDPNASALPPILTEQLLRLAKGAEGDFPAALSSTMRGVFFNRSLNRWVCTWSRNGKEYQRSWSAGKYGYETARGLAMHCRLEKLLSGEAHTLQKGMLAVFKPIMNSQTSPVADSAVSTKAEAPAAEEPEKRRSDLASKSRASPRPPVRLDSTSTIKGAESEVVGMKNTEASSDSSTVPKAQMGSAYSDMLTLMSQCISRNPEAFSLDADTAAAANKAGEPRTKDDIKELADPSVGEHFLAAVAAAAAVCDVPGFED